MIARTWKGEGSNTRVLDKISWTGTELGGRESFGRILVFGEVRASQF